MENKVTKKGVYSLSMVFLLFLFFLFIPSAAYADLEVQFTNVQSTALFVNEEGTWEVEIHNPDGTDVTDANLTITLPTGYDVTDTGGGVENAGPPHTLVWTNLQIPASSTIFKTYKAYPDCDASSGDHMQMDVVYDSGTKTETANSSNITINQLQISFFAESTDLSVGEEGTWTVRLHNPYGTAASNAQVVATIADGFRVTDAGGGTEDVGPPHTITWSNQTVPVGGNLDLTFKAIPECGTDPGLKMSAYVNCSSNDIDSSSITVKQPNLSITKTSGGSSQPTVHRDDTIVWDIEIKNGGNGDMVNGADITDTLGSGFTFQSINPNDGWPSWNTGPIAAGGTKTYHLTVTVDSCDSLTNQIDGSWNDGINTCQNISLTVNAALEKNSPDIDITVTPPSSVTYCGWNTSGNITTIKIKNTSAAAVGPANDFEMAVSGLPNDWGVKNITVTTGGAGTVTWDAVNEKFIIGDITESGGTRDTVEFTFQTGPTGSPCNVPAYYWGTRPVNLTFIPTYKDECGVNGTPPIIGPMNFSVDSSSVPYFRASKTGPRSASLGDTGLSYDLTVTYYAPAGSANVTVDIVDDYPDNFSVNDDGGGTVAGGTITWSNVILTPNVSWTNTIVLDAPTDPCDADTDYRNSLSVFPQVGSSTDCLGCDVFTYPFGSFQNTFINHPDGPIASSSKTVTYYNSMTGNMGDGPAGWGEVCTDNQYKTCYTFNTGAAAPSTWSNTDGNNNNITFNDHVNANQTYVSVDDVQVKGTSYPGWPAANFPGTALDLGYLDGTAAPKPDSGAEICITFTLHSIESSETWDTVDFSGLTIPGYLTACVGDEDYDQGVVINFTKSYVAVNTTPSPNIMDACEIKEFTIEIADNFNDWPDYWPLYDAQIKLDTKDNYTLLGGVSDPTYPITFTNINAIDGASISAIDPADNGDGTYTWDLGDIRHHNSNGMAYSPRPRIKFWMRKNCDETAKDWSAEIYFNDRCYDGAIPRVFDTDPGTPAGGGHHYPGEGMLLVKKAGLDITVEPPTIMAYTKYPEFDITIWNRGGGTAYNVDVLLNNDSDLVYWSHSVPSGAVPDTVTGVQGNNDVTFHYNSIPPGGKRYLRIKDKLTGCANTGITVTTSWGCGGSDCESINKNATVNLTTPTVMIIDHSVDHKTDYCGDNSRITIKGKNVGNTTAYNVKFIEELPLGLSYLGGDSYILSCGALTGAPTITTSGNTTIGITITWDFSSVLPLDADGEPSLPPECELTIEFGANIANCADAGLYSNGNKKAASHTEVDPPCNAEIEGSIITSSGYNLYTDPAHPHVTTVKEGRNVSKGTGWTTGTVIADSADTIEWRITLTSDGDYLATDVRLDDTIPSNTSYVSASTTVDGIPNGWDPTAGTLSLGDMAVGSSHVVIFRTMVISCTSDTVNTATATWGCLTGCGGTTPPTEQTSTDSVYLRTIAYIFDFTISTIAHPQTGVSYIVTDGGRMRVVMTNYGSRATLGVGDYLRIPLPKGFNYDSSCAPIISSNQAHGALDADPSTVTNSACGGANGELQWDNTRIDYIDTWETITLEFNLQADGCYLDTTCAGYGPDLEPPAIPSTTIQGTLQYSDSCSNPRSRNSNNLYINPRQPDLDISVDPAAPVIQPGDTQKTFIFTIVNSGDETAKNVALVGGAVNEPYVSHFGPGFQNPVVSTTSGGAVNVVGNTITISNMNNLASGANYTVTVTVDIIPNSPPADYWIDGEIKGTSLKCDGAATDAASQPCADKTYSDDKVTATAGEGKLVLRPNHTGTGKPCGEMIYIHTLRNNGGVADDFDLTATSSLGLSYLFYLVDDDGNITGAPITSIYLDAKGGANDEESFAIRLFIPCDTPENSVDVTEVTATFRSDPQVSRTVTDITTIATKLFMKKEARNVTQGGTFSDEAEGTPGEIIEYRVTFQNFSTQDLSTITISDPIPPFTDLVPDAYNAAANSVWIHFTFADGTTPDCYTNATAPVVTVDIPASCAVTTLKPGEKGELYYQVKIKE